MMRKILGSLLLAATLALSACANEGLDVDSSISECRVVVPWSKGGATDRTYRVIEEPLGAGLNRRVVDMNITGNAGLDGTKAALDTKAECVMSFGALQSIQGWHDKGELNQGMADVIPYVLFKNIIVVSVARDSELRQPEDFLRAFKGGKLKIATAGVDSGGERAAKAAMILFGNKKHELKPFAGGANAALAVSDGLADVVMQFANEQRVLIKDGDLLPLFVFQKENFTLDGLNIRPMSNYVDFEVPDMSVAFGMVFNKHYVSSKIVDQVNEVWRSLHLKKVANREGNLDAVATGEAALEIVESELLINDWIKASE